MATSSEGNTSAVGGESQLSACRTSVKNLRRILDQLFPDAQYPDILTVEDVIRRYPLTQLGAPAMSALEQSRRIARARRDFTQLGLAEYHAGLIYLYWGDCRAAAQQFAAARAQWSLAGKIPHGCLTHFAQGIALQHGYHFEAAMSQYGWTERCLSRNQAGAQARELAELGDELWPLLETAQQAIRPNLWPQEEGSAVNVRSNQRGTSPARPTHETPMAEGGPDGESEPEGAAAEGVPLPISNMPRVRPAFSSEPIPGHTQDDGRYRWYVVHARRDTLLSEISEGTWVLVDTEPGPLANGIAEEMVVIKGPHDSIGSVIVRPHSDAPGKSFFYLGYRTARPGDVTESPSETALKLDGSGHALRIPDAVVVGIVLGFWHTIMS